MTTESGGAGELEAPVLRAVGDGGLLLDRLGARVASALDALERSRPPGVIDLVPGAVTVLVVFDPAITTAGAVAGWATGALDRVSSAGASTEPAALSPALTIRVDYTGEDLAEVAASTGLGVDGLIERHTSIRWRVAFVGFAPGFAYLVPASADASWPAVARRAVPRAIVPAGSVAVAGGYCGVYPRASPGGWQLLGRTDARLWDLARAEPALLQPGAVVSFEAA